MVKAFYEDIIEPASEHRVKGYRFTGIPEIRRITGVNGAERVVYNN